MIVQHPLLNEINISFCQRLTSASKDLTIYIYIVKKLYYVFAVIYIWPQNYINMDIPLRILVMMRAIYLSKPYNSRSIWIVLKLIAQDNH
jgi:hypothetical protein